MNRHKKNNVPVVVACAAFALMMYGCATTRPSVLLLYHSPRGERLQPHQVARLLMSEMKGLKRGLWIAVDSSTDVPLTDTLELLPGKHRIRLWDLGIRTAGERTVQKFPSPMGSCLEFEFSAEAGHRYAFTVIRFDLIGWEVDLIDSASPTTPIHGVHCHFDRRGRVQP